MEYLKVHTNFMELLTVLTDEETSRLFKAMLEYAATGEDTTGFNGSALLVWKMAKQEIDETARFHELQRQKALLGGRPKTRKNPGKPEESRENPVKPEETRGLTGKKGRKNEEEKERSKEKEERDKDKVNDISLSFERFWEAYPRHVGKETARNSFRKLNPDEALLDTMLNAVERSKLSDQWRQDGGRYIPHPTTWLNQRRWEDELPTVSYRSAPRPAEKTVPAQEYHQRDYSHMQDEAMARFLEAVAEMEAEQAMKDRAKEVEGA